MPISALVQERTNRETRRGSKVARAYPSTKALERLAGAVMCDQDEGWQASRCFSEKKMSELYGERKRPEAEGRPSKERAAELRLIARKAIDASLEHADELEAE